MQERTTHTLIRFRVGLLALVVLLIGCSTEKNSPVNRTYHNITSRYNGYFNGKESIKEGANKIKDGYEVNYNEILPIYVYGSESDARAVYPQMDRAIEKASNVINNHSMYIERVEYNKWVDDCYLLIGKASFYKKDFEKAEEMMVYVANNFENNPIQYDAALWLARTYIESGAFSKARGYLNKCESESEIPEKKLAELKLVKADFFLKQKNYESATTELQRAIELTKRKSDKARLVFILAQIYRELGDSQKSMHYYNEVLSLNPDYKMAFYANIQSAMAFDGGNSSVIKSKLLDMAKDSKNEEFRDQIYYALAEIELKENNKSKGMEYFVMSYEQSTINTDQKARSFLRLGEIYYNDRNYYLAQAFYDSTVATIDKSLPEYPEVLERRNSLTRLVRDQNIVNREDSLQHLATLSKEEQELIVEDIVRKIIKEEEQRKREEEANALNMQNRPNDPKINQGQSNDWYFYNPATIAYGKTEFKKKWGTRKLEDNWRRKDKSSTAGIDFADDFGDLEDLGDVDTNATANDLRSPRYYLKDIPNTDKKMNVSHNNIIDALYDLGLVYKEKLKDENQAKSTFEDLVTRYDTSRHHVSAYYQLYLMYLSDGNTSKSNFYKDKVLNGYPSSQYAQLIKDPGYLDKEQNQASEVSRFYEQTYQMYKQKQYSTVISRVNQADDKYKQSELIPKFHYLKAQSIGATDSLGAYITALNSVIEQHNGTPEAKMAMRTLEYIGEIEESSSEEEEKANYLFKPDAKHHFLIILPVDGVDMNKAKIAVSDFNGKYFKNDELKISSTALGGGERIIIVKTFNNVFKGMDYYKAFEENKDILKDVKQSAMNVYPISVSNYPEFYKNADIEGYQKFFYINYK